MAWIGRRLQAELINCHDIFGIQVPIALDDAAFGGFLCQLGKTAVANANLGQGMRQIKLLYDKSLQRGDSRAAEYIVPKADEIGGGSGAFTEQVCHSSRHQDGQRQTGIVYTQYAGYIAENPFLSINFFDCL